MQVLDASYHVVHDYPGGATSLAPRLGKGASTLSHETTATGTAKLGLLDAVKITQLTGDLRILHAFAEACGAIVIPVVLHCPQTASSDVFTQLADTAREFSDVVASISTAAADGKITGNELAAVEREWGELVAQGASMVSLLRAKHQAGMPSAQQIIGAVGSA